MSDLEERRVKAEEMKAEAMLRQAVVAERIQAMREAETEDRKTLLQGAVALVGSVVDYTRAIADQEKIRGELMKAAMPQPKELGSASDA